MAKSYEWITNQEYPQFRKQFNRFVRLLHQKDPLISNMFQFRPTNSILLKNIPLHFLNFLIVGLNCFFPNSQYFSFQITMDVGLQARLIDKLNQAIAWSSARQKKLLQEVLNLERKINNLQDTKAIVRKKQPKQIMKEEIKEQDVAVQSSKRVDEIISKVKEQFQSLDDQGKKPKMNAVNKQKFVQPLPQIEKKPPIPTANRSKDPQVITHKPNYHYRNKNEVTGKITETPLTKNTGKISTSSSKKQQSIFQQSLEKANNANQKIVKKESVTVIKASNAKEKQPIKESNSLDSKEKKINTQKIMYVDFASFKIPVPNLINRASDKERKKVGNKKQIIQNLISQYNKNEMGYRQNQNKAMSSFILSVNKLAATRNRLPVQKGLTIQSRCRSPHLQTFNFENLIDHFQNLLNQNPISDQYEPNPKQIFKIKCWHQVLNEIFENQIQETINNLKPPPKLDVEFQMNTNPQEISPFAEDKQNPEGINPHLSQFYTLLQEQLQELKNMQNFDKAALKKLRYLISIGLYDGKRSPVFIQTEKHEEWKQYYEN